MILHAPSNKLSRQPRSFLFSLFREASLLAKLMSQMLHARRLAWLASGFAVLLLLWLGVLPNEEEWLKLMRSAPAHSQRAVLKSLAGLISFWGDFTTYSLLLAGSIWMVGWWRSSQSLKRLAVATLLSAALAGVTANVLRSSVGRPRPRTGLADGLYGPSLKSDFHSFPSAHTATAFGSSIPVLIAAPQIGAPLVVFAGAVSWSRLQLSQHHPTDVAIAIWIAALFGVPLGSAVRRLRAKGDRESETESPPDEPVEVGEAVSARSSSRCTDPPNCCVRG